MKKYSIIGAGNYLSDIFDIVHANDGKVMEICHNAPDSDSDRSIKTKQRIDLLGYEVRYYRSLDEFVPLEGYEYIMGLARPSKYKLVATIKDRFEINFCQLIHPKAHVGSNVHIGEGVIVAPGVVIAPNAHIGDFSIINRVASIGHESRVGKYSNIGPAATIAGSSNIGNNCIISMGVSILDQINVGKWSVIGAGAVVTKDLPDRVVALGIPAKVTRKNEDSTEHHHT